MPISSPQIPHELPRARTQACERPATDRLSNGMAFENEYDRYEVL
jgi:hypothetical protein